MGKVNGGGTCTPHFFSSRTTTTAAFQLGPGSEALLAVMASPSQPRCLERGKAFHACTQLSLQVLLFCYYISVSGIVDVQPLCLAVSGKLEKAISSTTELERPTLPPTSTILTDSPAGASLLPFSL